MDDILWFLLIGTASGWLSGQITKGRGFGLVGDMMVGIVGAIIGGFVFRLIGLEAYGLMGQLVTATVGSIILLMALKQISAKRA